MDLVTDTRFSKANRARSVLRFNVSGGAFFLLVEGYVSASYVGYTRVEIMFHGFLARAW